MKKLLFTTALLAAMVTTAAPAVATAPKTMDVNGCGVAVPARTVATVQSDFTCTVTDASGPLGANGIVLGPGATLNLNGHTVTLVQGSFQATVVKCLGHCTVGGPGTLTSAAAGTGTAIDAVTSRLQLHDVTVSGMGGGIYAIAADVRATNVSIQAGFWGVVGARRVTANNVDVALTGGADAEECISATKGDGKIDGTNVTVSGCWYGVSSFRATLVGLTVTNSHIGAYVGGKLQLRDSSVTGSAIVDLSSSMKPKLVNTTCGTSSHVTTDQTWHVCAND